ncbi:hypothetical protein [Desulfosediminicola flagellatus]
MVGDKTLIEASDIMQKSDEKIRPYP